MIVDLASRRQEAISLAGARQTRSLLGLSPAPEWLLRKPGGMLQHIRGVLRTPGAKRFDPRDMQHIPRRMLQTWRCMLQVSAAVLRNSLRTSPRRNDLQHRSAHLQHYQEVLQHTSPGALQHGRVMLQLKGAMLQIDGNLLRISRKGAFLLGMVLQVGGSLQHRSWGMLQIF
jgi:hypothetical protein